MKSKSALSPGETKLARTLFGSSSELELDNINNKRIQKAIGSLRTILRAEFGKLHFARNRGYFIPGAILSVLAVLAMFLGAVISTGAPGRIMLLSNGFVLIRAPVLTVKGSLPGAKLALTAASHPQRVVTDTFRAELRIVDRLESFVA